MTIFNTWANIPNIASLRALSSIPLCDEAADVVNVIGYYSASVTSAPDGGGGIFIYDSTDSTTADDGGMVIVDAAGRRWKRQTESKNINVLWFGAVSDWFGGHSGTNNATAFQAAIDYVSLATFPPKALVLYVPTGRYRVGDTLHQTGQMVWRGDGKDGTNGELGGSLVGFDHSNPYCITMDSTSSLCHQSQFQSIAFFGVNQSIQQHCIALIGGQSLLNGSIHNVEFFNFTGYCIYVPSGSTAYNQNLSIVDVSTNTVGGFYGVHSSISLTNTIMVVQNFAGDNGVNTAFPQPVFFDFRSCREVKCNAIDVEGGSLNDVIFTIGSNNWVVVDGLHVENGPPVNVFEIVTGGYPYGDGRSVLTVRHVSAAAHSGAFLKFANGVNDCHVILENVFQSGNLPNLIDYGTGVDNFVDIHNFSQTEVFSLSPTFISRQIIKSTPIVNIALHYFNFEQVESPFVNLRGQWLDGAYGGPIQLSVDATTVDNIGMFDDATEGRVFELVSKNNTNPIFLIKGAIPTDLLNDQVAICVRAYLDTAQANLQYGVCQTSVGLFTKFLTCDVMPIKAWHTSWSMVNPETTVLSNLAYSNIMPTTPAVSGVLKIRISAVWINAGCGIPYLLGGGTAAKAIQWSATAAPTYGSYYVGDRVVNSVPAVGQPKAWSCTVAGSPGTWVSEGNL